MTIDVDHADGQGSALSTISPEVEGVLPSKVGVEVAIGRCAHEARVVVPPDQLLIGVSIHATWFGPAEAIRADQPSQVGASCVFDSFFLQLLSYHYYIIVAEVLFFCQIVGDIIATRAGSNLSLCCFRWEGVGTGEGRLFTGRSFNQKSQGKRNQFTESKVINLASTLRRAAFSPASTNPRSQ